MVQVIEQGDLFGRIGKSFGEGLGGAVEKSMSNKMLSSGLQKVRDQFTPGSQPKPLDILSKLLGIPGMTPEQASQLMPYIRQELLTSQAPTIAPGSTPIGYSGNAGAAPNVTAPQKPEAQVIGGAQISSGETKPKTLAEQQRSSFYKKYGFELEDLQSPEDIERAKQMRPVFTGDDTYNAALQLTIDNPVKYPDIATAMPVVEANQRAELAKFDETINKAQRREDFKNKGLDLFNKKLEKKLQKAGDLTFTDVPGTAQDKLENEVIKMIKEGVTPSDAASIASEKGLSFAKSRNDTLAISALNTRYEKDLKAKQKAYKEMNSLEIMKDDLISNHDLSEQRASTIAFPYSEGVKKSLDKLDHVVKGLTSADSDYKKYAERRMKNIDSLVNDLIKNMTEDDSLKALQYDIKEKGYEDEWFINAIKKAGEEGKLKLNDRQQRELDSLSTFTPTLRDIWMGITKLFGGKDV